MDIDILAKKIYNAYCEAVGGKAFNGDDLPKADVFFKDPAKQKQADAWRSATKPAYDLLVKTTQNLGNPGYGQSTATTMAIDELRDEAFNYLGVTVAENVLRANINGVWHDDIKVPISYEDICTIAYGRVIPGLTCTWHVKGGQGGFLDPQSKPLKISGEVIFNIVSTSNS